LQKYLKKIKDIISHLYFSNGYRKILAKKNKIKIGKEKENFAKPYSLS